MSSFQLVAHRFEDKQRSDDVKVQENVDFSALLLSPRVQDGLTKAGFVKPSPIQLQAIPLGKFGLDLIVQAKSGTGKTCIFAVIALENIVLDSTSVQTLVLAPTREIASQICDVILSIGSSLPSLRCHYFIGGLSLAEDKVKLKKCHIAVGTPGRIKQLIECNYLSTSAIRLFVLDEADKLLDKDFQKSINWIYQKLPHNKQMLALSATYPENLAKLLTNYMRSPAFVRLNTQKPALLGVIQFYTITKFHPLPHIAFQHKFDMLQKILTNIPFSQCLIFINLQSRAQLLCDELNKQGWSSTYICGSQNQVQRLRTMAQLKSFQCRILVSTDLTARGIDCQNVDVIINVDLPKDLETYLHRVGRAGRFGSKGLAISIVSEGNEKDSLFSMNLSASLDICELPQPLSANVWNYSNVKECPHSIEANSDLVRDSFVCILNDALLNSEENVAPVDSSHDNSSSEYTITKYNQSNIELSDKSEGSKVDGIYSFEDRNHYDIAHTVPNEEPEENKHDRKIPATVLNFQECTDGESNFHCFPEQNSETMGIMEANKCLNKLSLQLAKNLKLTDINDQSTENVSYQQERYSKYEIADNLLHFYKNEPCAKSTSYTEILKKLDNFEVGNESYSSEQCRIYVPSKKLLEEVKNFLHHSNEQYWKGIEATINCSNTEQLESSVHSLPHESGFKAMTENTSKIFPHNNAIKDTSADKVKTTINKGVSSFKSKENMFFKKEILQTHNHSVKKPPANADDTVVETNISKDHHSLKENQNEDDIDAYLSYNLTKKGQDMPSTSSNSDSAVTSQKLDADSVSLSVIKLNTYRQPSSHTVISGENNIYTSSRAQKDNIYLNSSIIKNCNFQYSDSEETTNTKDSKSEIEYLEKNNYIEQNILQDNYAEQTFVPCDCCSFPACSQAYLKERHYKPLWNSNTPSNWNMSYGNSFPFDECKSCCEYQSFTPDRLQQSDYGYCSAQAENNYDHLYHRKQYATNNSCKYCMQHERKQTFSPNFFLPTKIHRKSSNFSSVCNSCYWDQCRAASEKWCYYYSMYMSEMLKWRRPQRKFNYCK